MLRSLTLWDYSDRELLFIVHDEQKDINEGYAFTDDVAETLGIEGDHPTTSVGIRLSWLARYGVIEKHPKKEKLWCVSPDGDAIRTGQLTVAQNNALSRGGSGGLVLVTRLLAHRYGEQEEFAGHMMRREWMRGTGAGRPRN